MPMTPTLFSLGAAAVELQRDVRWLSRGLRNTPPDGTTGKKNVPAWRLATRIRRSSVSCPCAGLRLCRVRRASGHRGQAHLLRARSAKSRWPRCGPAMSCWCGPASASRSTA
jgi:hypothetical protein